MTTSVPRLCRMCWLGCLSKALKETVGGQHHTVAGTTPEEKTGTGACTPASLAGQSISLFILCKLLDKVN